MGRFNAKWIIIVKNVLQVCCKWVWGWLSGCWGLTGFLVSQLAAVTRHSWERNRGSVYSYTPHTRSPALLPSAVSFFAGPSAATETIYLIQALTCCQVLMCLGVIVSQVLRETWEKGLISCSFFESTIVSPFAAQRAVSLFSLSEPQGGGQDMRPVISPVQFHTPQTPRTTPTFSG